MIDPVNNFRIPDEWIRRAKIPHYELRDRITSGLYVLLSDGSLLRRGYTTGTTAAAAAKASVLSLRKEVKDVSVPTPGGLRALMSVSAKNGKASAIKEAGDHAFDVTGGIEILAEAKECDTIAIEAGPGIGRKKGMPAINPCPLCQIKEAIREALPGLKGACVTISVPLGEELAKRTLNEKIGITGGISILGTTGFVEPWNEHLGEMKDELVRGSNKLVLTTGRIGMRISYMLFPGYTVVLIGSDISRGLEAAKGEVIICGLAGLILKWAFPDILRGSGFCTIGEMVESDPQNPRIDRGLKMAESASGKRVVLLNRDGTILRESGEKKK
jgi:cobalt-precorrin-5B (C1)-methyltransferase